jgi:hypothetical protein
MPAQNTTATDSVTLILQMLTHAPWWHIVVAYLLVNAGGIVALVSQFWHQRELRKLYEARIKDKDTEIERQAKVIKNLENTHLKTKRK